MALEGIFNQDYHDFEILIGDDNPPNEREHRQSTQEVVACFDASRIRYIDNARNLGYALNLKNLVEQASGEIIYLFAQDDIMAMGALRKTYEAFALDPDVGVVTRPYFWFMKKIQHPVRAVTPYDPERDAVLSLKDGERAFMKIFESVGQLSGLAYRRDLIEEPFHEDVFPAHIYPFAGILG
jgi:GT2 family glycosyltransferase